MNIKKFIKQNPKVANVIQFWGTRPPQPFFLLVHLTLKCNCQCNTCYQKQDPFYFLKGGMIKPEDFEKILKDIKKSFLIKPKIHFFGGEPLVNPHFSMLLRLAQEYKIKTSITTNGILLDTYLDDILHSDLNQINISIDDLGVQHDFIRGYPGCFEKAIANIKKLRLKEINQRTKRKVININCVISENNYAHLTNLYSYLIENKLDIDVLAFQHMYFDPENKPVIDLAILKSQIEKIKRFRTTHSDFSVLFIPEIKFNDLLFYYNPVKDNTYFKNRCNIPWLGLNILPNLEVTPGGGVLGCNNVVGNLKNDTLRKIWNNDRMKQFRQNLLYHGLPTDCFRCCHRQYY